MPRIKSAQKQERAISSLDIAAEKGIMHPNNAARRKARLMKKLGEAQALPSVETKQEEAS